MYFMFICRRGRRTGTNSFFPADVCGRLVGTVRLCGQFATFRIDHLGRSHRDTLYAAEADIIPESQSFELLYWTIDDDVLCPVPEGMVRIDFQAAHLVRRTEQGCMYRYIQTSDAKIPLMPDVLLQKIQVGILMDEVSGLTRAVSQ